MREGARVTLCDLPSSAGEKVAKELGKLANEILLDADFGPSQFLIYFMLMYFVFLAIQGRT